ncbi:MHYT domain-containing protein [Streptomyces sp. NPDC059524]|uniref:MHYT domain-containing protein n=1 Tax=Streptomyces sp. NPDC059524 TaxID=3346856 RepID=UPI00369051E0
MEGTIDGFTYGAVTPAVGYAMAYFGSALGLRCTTRSLRFDRSRRRPAWLALGAGAIGSGIWTMHFIAMMGFSVVGAPVEFEWTMTYASLAVAIAVVSVGVFIVGFQGPTVPALLAGGVITGLGVGGMHYMGMAAMTVRGASLDYETSTVALSLVIAVVAATAALWAAVQDKGLAWSLGASLIMGVAVTGMHYTGMAALKVHLHSGGTSAFITSSSFDMLVPMLIGPLAFLVIAGAIVMFDPLMVMGPTDRAASPSERLSVDVPSLARRERSTRPAGMPGQARHNGNAYADDRFSAFRPSAPGRDERPRPGSHRRT